MNTRFSFRFCQICLVIAMAVICLGGVGVAQAQTATLSRTSLNMGPVLIGQSVSSNVILKNTGTAVLNISSIATGTSVYTQTNNCVSPLAAGASCTISVSFAPTSAGAASDVLSVSDDATNSPQTMTLAGSGITPAYLSAVNFAFGSVNVNTTSAAKTVTVTNRETSALAVSISVSAGYAETDTCGGSIPASGSCTISMTFTPTAVGAQNGSLTVTPSVGPVLTGNLTGTGIAAFTLSPTSLAFGNQIVGTTSAAKTVTLTNKTTAALGISGVSVPAPFAQTSTCGSSLAASASCTFSVTFKPTSAVASSGNLAFTLSNGGAQSVSLTGTGLLPLSVTPTSIAFGNQATNTASAAQTVTIKNTATTSLSGLTVSTSGTGFAQTNGCTSTLAAGASCTDSIVFTPTSTGAKTGTVSVNYTGGTAQTVSLTGTGTAAVAISPTSLAFGNVNVGSTSAAQTITINNAQSTAMSISSIVASAGFAETTTCGSSLASKASCTISVTFKPTVGGAQTGTITITDNAAGSPQTVALTGTGAASVTITPNVLPAFGPQLLNTTSAGQSVTVKNTSGSRVTVTVSTTAQFGHGGSCGTRVANNGTCTFNVTFTPTAAGVVTGTLSVTAGSTTQTMALSGTGATTAVGFSPTSLAFGNQNVGTSSAAQVLTITNAQASAVSIGSISFSVASTYTQTNTCGTSLAANSSCTVSVVFTPTSGGSKAGTMSIPVGTTTLSVPVSGNGIALISILPLSINSGPVPMNVASSVSNVTVKNNTTVSVGITSIAVTGNFSQTNNCTTLAPGASCTVGVTFTPLSTGVLSGTLTINDNYAGLPQTVVTLAGTGLSDNSLSPISLAFGNQIVQSASAAKTLTLTNNQPFPMSITGITMTGDYSQTNTCGTALAAKGTCTISAVFLPLAAGSRVGTISIAVSPGNAVSATLGGTGIQPPITALPAQVTFGPTVVNGTSAMQPVTVTNATAGAFTISSIATSSNFVQTNNCPATLAGAASCTVNVGFSPIATGTVTGQLMITDTAAGSPQIVLLSGAATTAPTSVTVLPASVSLGIGGTQQFTATATFSGQPNLDVTASATWSSGNPSVVSVNSTGLATVLAASDTAIPITASFGGVSNSANPAWLSALSTLPITCPTPSIDMKILIITNGQTESQFPAITQVLNYLGTPYTVFDMAANPGGITAPFLSDGSCHGYFQGIIFADGGYIYTLTGMPLIVSYEQTFGVRQINWYTFPTPDFGFTAWGASNTAAGGGTATWAANASIVFPYVNTANPLVIDPGAWTYFDTAMTPASGSGASVTPLLTSGNNVVSLIYNTGGQYPREMLTQTFASNQYMQHDLVMAYGLINWVTKGLFLGEYHVYATQSIDDFFINDAEWIPGTSCTNPITHDRTLGDDPSLPNFRLMDTDMTQLVAWQAAKQKDPLLKNFELTIAFNGVGTVGNSDWTGVGTQGTDSRPQDTLLQAFPNYQQFFHWMSHTYDHPETLSVLTKSGPPDSSGDTLDLEVLTNLWVAGDTVNGKWLDTDESDAQAANSHLSFTDFDPHSMVTPGVTGLDVAVSSQALFADGIFTVVTDTSVTTTATNNNGPNPSPNVGIVNSYAPGIYEVPRHPNDVFFNAANWADDDAEFLCIYGPQGTNQTPFNTFTPAQILDFTSTTFVNNMLLGDMDPEMFHQPNLHFSDNGANLGMSGSHVSALITDTYDQTFSKYEALYNLPVLTPTQAQMAVAMQGRNTYNLSGVTATWTGGADPSISITVPANTVPLAIIPVTGLNSQGAETYGGQFISHIQVNAGQTVSLPAE